jgi:hypothetical protein
MLVWAEANQGLLSVAALVSALVLALVEQRRALIAEQFARDADAAADRRALEASRDADRRAREASADADRKASEASADADRKASAAIAAADRKADLAAKRASDTAIREYVDVILELIKPYLSGAASARSQALSHMAAYPDRDFVNTGWQHAGAEIVSALAAILPAAPRSPPLILATQRTINTLNLALGFGRYSSGDGHLSMIDQTTRALTQQIEVLQSHRPSEEKVTSLRRKRAEPLSPAPPNSNLSR